MAKKNATAVPAGALRSRIVGHERVPASVLLNNPANHRRHTKKQQNLVTASLDELGIVKSIIVNKTTGHVVDGHDRLRDARARGVETLVDVEYVELSEAEEKKALAILDAMVELGSVDTDALDSLLADVMPDTDNERLGDWFKSMRTAKELFDEVPIPPVPEEPVSRIGDLWILGRHRLVCGDCTNRSVVDKLMGGRTRVDLTMTDPPYGVGWDYWDKFDDSKDALQVLIEKFLPIGLGMSDVVALTPGITNERRYPTPAWTLCWFYGRGSGQCSWGFNSWQPLLVYGSDPHLANGNGCHPDGFRLDVDGYEVQASPDDRKEEKLLKHSCPKPLSVWRRFMQRLTYKAEAVYDPFGGSGTTLIAADQLGIDSFLIELSPSYCDVIVERWVRHTGGTPQRFSANDKASG